MRIMVGVDDSVAGQAAIAWAIAVASRNGATVEAVRSWVYSPRPLQDLQSAEEMDRRAEEAVQAALANHDTSGIGVDVAVVRGPARHALLRRVEEQQPSMVVVGRRSSKDRAVPRMLGSVGRRLVDASPAPVVVVSDDRAIAPDRRLRVMAAVDGSESSERALRWATDLASGTGSAIVLAHVIAPAGSVGAVETSESAAREMLGSAAEMVAEAGVEVSTVVGYGDPRRELERIAAEHDVDLIVVGPRGLGGFAKLVVGTVAGHLTEYADVPVAVVPG
ncbi:MAG: universal stress protein [Acidimicrobiales bacterium]